jgi:type VI secretion system secreted protein Hcp
VPVSINVRKPHTRVQAYAALAGVVQRHYTFVPASSIYSKFQTDHKEGYTVAFDAFMQISDIPGESKDGKHDGWIELLSFRHGAAQPISRTASSAGGATAERANFSPVTISKLVDRASPKLWEACFTGKHIKEITIELCRAGGDKQKYLVIKMEQVLLANFDQGGGDDFPVETVSFSPGKITMDYIQQSRADGTPAGSVAAGWDLTQNKVA